MAHMPTLIEMLQAGVHFGHKTSKRYPKMESNIFGVRNGIHILDLEKTQKALLEVAAHCQELAKKNGVILFVGTKSQAKEIVKTAAERAGMPYVTTRWIGGTLTNFTVISRMIKKFKKLKSEQASGELEKYTKKEQLEITREIEEMNELLGGIESLTKKPDAVYIVDIKKERTALREARKSRVPVIAPCDTNCNPELVDHCIPANDDARKSIELITNVIADAIIAGKGAIEVPPQPQIPAATITAAAAK